MQYKKPSAKCTKVQRMSAVQNHQTSDNLYKLTVGMDDVFAFQSQYMEIQQVLHGLFLPGVLFAMYTWSWQGFCQSTEHVKNSVANYSVLLSYAMLQMQLYQLRIILFRIVLSVLCIVWFVYQNNANRFQLILVRLKCVIVDFVYNYAHTGIVCCVGVTLNSWCNAKMDLFTALYNVISLYFIIVTNLFFSLFLTV